MKLTVYGPLRGITGSKTIEVADPERSNPVTVERVIRQLLDQHPQAKTHLFGQDESLQGSVRILVDGDRASLETPCPPTAEVAIIPAAQGG